ncbi:Claudin-18 [Chelonia mydas]|uniref:Claudin n=1 Tax=Chelonia mydas TaxID=8469 RepID=M7CCF9_CHEMY|nr:Claudin-18 [Chelonia mydas]
MHWLGGQEKAREVLNFNFLFGQRGKLQVTMQSSSAEVTMMESQKSSSLDLTGAVLFDSFNGDGGNTEAGFGDEEDDDDDVVDSSQQARGETSFPDIQELFLTLDLEPVPPEPTQGCFLDPAGGEGTSGVGGIIAATGMDMWSTQDLYNNPVTAVYNYQGLWRTCVRESSGFTECRSYFTILGLPGRGLLVV